MLHQFNRNRSAAVQPRLQQSGDVSLRDIIQESRRHYLRYLSTAEDLVRCEIEILRLEKQDGHLAMFVAPTPEYRALKYKKEVAEYAMKQYKPVIQSMAALAMQSIDNDIFEPEKRLSKASSIPQIDPDIEFVEPPAPVEQLERENSEITEAPLAPTPPSSSAVVNDGQVKSRARSNSM